MTNQHSKVPLQIEHLAWFSQHLGGRFRTAGLRIQFHDNQEAGIRWRVACPEEYQAAILQGLHEAMSGAFPQYLASSGLWITEVLVDKISSSPDAFYRAALLVVAQAKALLELSGRAYNKA